MFVFLLLDIGVSVWRKKKDALGVGSPILRARLRKKNGAHPHRLVWEGNGEKKKRVGSTSRRLSPIFPDCRFVSSKSRDGAIPEYETVAVRLVVRAGVQSRAVTKKTKKTKEKEKGVTEGMERAQDAMEIESKAGTGTFGAGTVGRPRGLLDLPAELVFHVFLYLGSAADICRLGATCLAFYVCTVDRRVWERLYRALPHTIPDPTPHRWNTDFKWLYRARTTSVSAVLLSSASRRAPPLSPPSLDSAEELAAAVGSILKGVEQTQAECISVCQYNDRQVQYHGRLCGFVPDGYGIMVVLRSGPFCVAPITLVGRPSKSCFEVLSASARMGHLVAGDWFEGEWRAGILHAGRARFSCDTRHRYEGQIANGWCTGRGTLTLVSTGKRVYKGEWHADKCHGFGVMHYSNGMRYKGMFKRGDRSGWGTAWYPDGTVSEGQWKCGQQNGRSVVTFPSGARYKGQWKGGQYCDYGVVTCSEGSRHECTWAAGLANGYGTYTNPDGSRFAGHHKNDKHDGYGVFVSKEYRYEGHYRDDKRHGPGVVMRADGICIYGRWANDQLVSPGPGSPTAVIAARNQGLPDAGATADGAPP